MKKKGVEKAVQAARRKNVERVVKEERVDLHEGFEQVNFTDGSSTETFFRVNWPDKKGYTIYAILVEPGHPGLFRFHREMRYEFNGTGVRKMP